MQSRAVSLAPHYESFYHHYPDPTLHRAFERQVARAPDAIAIRFGDQCWTYQQINLAANHLAQFLIHDCHVKLEDRVALSFRAGPWSVIAMLAVLKADAAFVPIGPDIPVTTIEKILNSCAASVIVTDRFGFSLFDRFRRRGAIRVLNLESRQLEFTLAAMSSNNPISAAAERTLACVMYPRAHLRGVQLEHHSLLNAVHVVIDNNRLDNTSVGAKFAPFYSDTTVCEVFSILLSGGKLQIISDQDRADAHWMNDVFQRHAVTFAMLPSLFAERFCRLRNTSLVSLMIGGARLKQVRAQDYVVLRFYGQPETAGLTTLCRLDEQSSAQIIGRPITNLYCAVVDQQLRAVPIGVIGELLIGGAGVARGYLNQPDLTTQRFVRSQYGMESKPVPDNAGPELTTPVSGQHLYRTGDLVRRLSDGNLELVGRQPR